ncbi:glycosyltransferase family 2 protein [Tropicimonas sediminicola]|uniref:glycosyltransferase family 2 protein n=1 Tax=Tropicimonas sediminicola TaxID=1031541 RepID=UPI000B793CA4|nr:glycosyltransferase family A protein [Tropicimonas sediminicola]
MPDRPRTFPAPETVAVVLAVFNGERFLGAALASVFAQSRVPDEVIVVDDGSTDSSGQTARSHPGVRVIRQENQGLSAARNTGLAAVQSDAVVFLDDDDRMLPENLATGLRLLSAYPQAAFVAGCATPIDAAGTRTSPDKRLGSPGTCSFATLLAGHSFVPPSTVMFRRAAFEATGPFDTALRSGCEDLDIYLRMARVFEVHAHPALIVEYRRHGRNITRNRARLLKASLDLLERNRALVADDPELKAALEAGRRRWIATYGPGLPSEAAGHLKQGHILPAVRAIGAALRYHPQGLWRYLYGKLGRG